ncbi:MAG: energy-coupling factor ABC transporter ATP-binding protein [Lachnospiraceae bacterium]|nr:energy-coupling factor ABC transporter ATP-binding protein [Lachnospiraceae bacterium]
MALLDIKDLSFTYPGRTQSALKGITFSVEEGEFVVLCGESGCGKSTLLRNLKTILKPYGKRSGEILYRGVPLDSVKDRQQAEEIGFVLQNLENQIVTDKVWHELAFGLENLGIDRDTMRLRVAEMASFFGIQEWFHNDVSELSGGQKQMLNLAAVMAMQPRVLILDEPTSQLNPIAASDFLNTIAKINRDLGTTVILSEHRLEDVLPNATKIIVMDKGTIAAWEEPRRIGRILAEKKHTMLSAMPVAMQSVYRLGREVPEVCPITVGEGKRWIDTLGEPAGKLPEIPDKGKLEPAVTFKDVWFRYTRDGDDVIRDLNAVIYKGEIFSIIGSNGAGKSTAASLMSGINRPYRGKISIFGEVKNTYKGSKIGSEVSLLIQNPQSFFVKDTVREDLGEVFKGSGIDKKTAQQRILDVAKLTYIEEFLDYHPYDLSGGEQQRAALAKVLLRDSEILVLDEPVKGMDGFLKKKMADIMLDLKKMGKTVVLVSHDLEFCAGISDRCALFFDGGIAAINDPRSFFAENSFYTTAANRMVRHIDPRVVTIEDIVALWKAENCQKEQ